jgi:hypothetical protein
MQSISREIYFRTVNFFDWQMQFHSRLTCTLVGDIATILNMPINVLGFRGKSQVEVLSSAERGTLVNSNLHECLRIFHAKDICITSCEKSLDFMVTAVRKSNLTNMNLGHCKLSKSAVFGKLREVWLEE